MSEKSVISEYMASIGKKGGSVKSEKKTASAVINSKKGGRKRSKAMTIEEAKQEIEGRKGWLGIEEVGNKHEYAFYRQRPITTYAFPLDTAEQKDKAAEWLSIYTANN